MNDDPMVFAVMRDLARIELVTLLSELYASEDRVEPWAFCHPRRTAWKRARVRELHSIVAQLDRADSLQAG